jgi:hypothetical protein
VPAAEEIGEIIIRSGILQATRYNPATDEISLASKKSSA